MKITIIEPHYDDAWINLGGYILINPDIEFLILSLCDDTLNNRNETKSLEDILPNVKTKALHFKGLPWSLRDSVPRDEMKKLFCRKNKKSLFNRKGIKNFNEIESIIENEISGYDLALLPYGAKHPQHLVTSMLRLKGEVKYYIEYPYPYNGNFMDILDSTLKTVIDISDILVKKIEIFKKIFPSQKAVLHYNSPWGTMEEVNREVIIDKRSVYANDECFPPPKKYNFLRKIKRFVFLFIPDKTKIRINNLLGISTPMATPDRTILEQVIFPYYQGEETIRKILFVGIDWYTAHYYKYFLHKEYWTIDNQKKQRNWAKKNHIVDGVANLSRYFEPEYFDLIFFNGVYGFGVNSKEQCELTFQSCYDHLRAEGEFVLGWDNHPKVLARTIPLKEIENINKFKQKIFPPLQTWRYHSKSGAMKVYDFYVK